MINTNDVEYQTLATQYSMFANELNEKVKHGWYPCGEMIVMNPKGSDIIHCYILLRRPKQDD